MNIRLLVIIMISVFSAISCSPQSGSENDGDSERDDSWPFQPDGDNNIPNYECSNDVDCNDPSYKCEDHFCVPRNLTDGDKDTEDDDNSQWPCGLDCASLPNTFRAHCGDQGVCIIDECWPAYDNCDDMVENGCEQEIYTNMQHCGKCRKKCELKNASEECVEGQCLIVACEGEYQDADELHETGCECIDIGSDVFGDGIDSNCDGIDGMIEDAIFVSEDGSGDGSKHNPLGDIQEAIDMALENQVVLVSKGDYAGPIFLREGVSIYGGWDVNFRTRAYENAANINVSAYLDQENENLPVNLVGIYAEGIKRNTRLEIMNVIIEDNLSPSGSNIGIWMSDCNYRLTLSRIRIEPGNGGDGIDGTDGRAGRNGIQGQQGQAGCENDSNFFCGDSNCSIPQGGRGGSSPCGGEGGVGGKPGLGNDDGRDYPGESGNQGTGGTQGGAGGLGADNLTDNYECECEGCSACVWTNGEQGKHGDRGLAGTPGNAGKAEGEIIDGMWYALPGGNGSKGACGPGGGGGGGGGGGRCGTAHDCKRYGSAGSGGGGGGEGGGGGSGASSGGGSFGIFMLASSPDIKESEIICGDGGNGGNGGQGGTGGQGGAGGPAPDFGSNQRSGGCGGSGGNGGAGGVGGGGGGGAGGPSWGLYLLDRSMPNLLKTNIVMGKGGRGGNGGNQGEAGLRGEIFIEEQEIEEGDGDEEFEIEFEIEFEAEFEPEFEPEFEIDAEQDQDFESEDESDGDIDQDLDHSPEEDKEDFDPDPELDSEPDSQDNDLFSPNPDRDIEVDYDKIK